MPLTMTPEEREKETTENIRNTVGKARMISEPCRVILTVMDIERRDNPENIAK